MAGEIFISYRRADQVWALAGGPDRVLAYAPSAQALEGRESKMAVNPKTGEIIYVASVQDDTNIDLLTLAKH